MDAERYWTAPAPWWTLHPMIVVTTPTGNIGHQVLEGLLERGAPVRAIARDPSRLDPGLRDRIEVVAGSHGDAATVDEAFAGADAVFWLVPPDPQMAEVTTYYAEFSRPACAAFDRRGVRRVVGISALGRGFDGPTGLAGGSLAMDDVIAATGVAYRALTMPSFMDNLLRQVDAIRAQGAFFAPLDGERRRPTCATQDIAAVAVEQLLDETWTGQAEVPVLGPEDLSQQDMASIVSEVLDRPIRFQPVPVEAFRSQLLEHGMGAAMAQGMAT
jgi:uncharacterized protein YbjT (DUF2867 family)